MARNQSKTIYVSILSVIVTIVYWISLSLFFPSFPLWTPVQLTSCLIHLCCLALWYAHPRPASLLTIACYCISSMLPAGYAAIERYGVYLMLGYLSYSEKIQYSIPIVATVLCSEAVSIPLYRTPIPQFLTSAICFCLAFVIGLYIKTRYEKTTHKQQIEAIYRERRIAQELHDAVTSELSSIVLLCQQEKLSKNTSKNISIIGAQAEQALHNTRQIILGLHDNNHQQPFIDGLFDCIKDNDTLLNAAGFQGHTTISERTELLTPYTTSIILPVLKEIYANILRHCPSHTYYDMCITIS